MAYLLVKRLTDKARVPTLRGTRAKAKGSAFAARYDLYAIEEATVPANGRRLIGTGLAMTIPEGHYGRVAPRSGLAVKHGISVGAGCVDYELIF